MNRHPDPPAEATAPSRSQQRREALALLALAEQLVEMPPARVQRIDLPEEVRAEIANVRRIGSRGARKRQLAYLAKLMRRHDESMFDAARAALGQDREMKREQAAALQRLEALRERLVSGDDEYLGEFIAAHPQVDRQHLRSLIRQARTERDGDKPPHAYRELFRLLRELEDAATP